MIDLIDSAEEVEEVEGVGELARGPTGRRVIETSEGASSRYGVVPRTCPSFLVDLINLDF